MDSGSLSKELGFWIPIVRWILDSLSWISDSKTLGSWLHKQKLFGAIPCCAFSTFLISFTENDGFLMATSPELSYQNDLDVLFLSLHVWISWLEEVDISSCYRLPQLTSVCSWWKQEITVVLLWSLGGNLANRDSGIGTFVLAKSGILNFGILNSAQGILTIAKDWHPESKWSGIQCLESWSKIFWMTL